jgi:Ala-tRNA(Pro) deacylase
MQGCSLVSPHRSRLWLHPQPPAAKVTRLSRRRSVGLSTLVNGGAYGTGLDQPLSRTTWSELLGGGAFGRFHTQEEAVATHVPGREWAKAVVCIVDNQPTIVVLPADHLVDLDRFREACGARSLRLAREAEFRPLYSTASWERCRRSGRSTSSRWWSTKSLTLDPEILFNAGSHREAIRMRYRDFEELVKPTVADFGMPIRVS